MTTDTKAQNPTRFEDGFDVGDVLSESWGYDQTNVDFYTVVRRTKASVWLAPTGSEGVPGTEGFMSQQVRPTKVLGPREKLTTRLQKGDKLTDGRVIEGYAPVGGWNDFTFAPESIWTVTFKDGSTEDAAGFRSWTVERPIHMRRVRYYGEGEQRRAYVSVSGHGSAQPWGEKDSTYCSWYA